MEAGTTGDGTLDGEITAFSSTTTSSAETASTVSTSAMETDGFTIPFIAAVFDTTILRWHIGSRAHKATSVSARQQARSSNASTKVISDEAILAKASAAPVA
jgi:hypothetical protein